MDRQLLYELIGYVASALVAVSLMMSSILRLRLINLVKCRFVCSFSSGLLELRRSA